MKKWLILLMLLGPLTPAFADNEDSDIGPRGPQGLQGPAGDQGSTGAQGAQGSTGLSGKNGTDASVEKDSTRFVVGAEVRAYDSQYLQVKPFVDVTTLGGPYGSNDIMAGVRFQFKVGKSYEEKLIEKLENRFNVLQPR